MEIRETEQTPSPLIKHRTPVWFQLLIALGFFLVLAFFSGLGEDNGALQQYRDDPGMITMLKVGQAIIVIFVFILPAMLFSMVLRQEKLRFLRLNKFPKLPHLLVGITICLIALPIVSGTSIWNSNMHLPESMHGIEEWMRIKEKSATESIELFFIDRSVGGLILNLFVVAFMAGLSEEIFFRGFLQRLFIENKMNVHIAVWLTAILFSAIHIQFFGFIPRMLLGAVLGYLYAYTNNLWVPIIAHTVNNAFAVVMAYITGSITEDPMSPKPGEEVNLSLMGLSVLLVGGMIWFLYKRREQPNTGPLNA
ncbi:MAG: family intrarane metalloprotease [Bacteroidetes bacterium]|jgi:membrane protease YdiL (CAAX protease family)|nr:family intrarane metalloprotease [Bacteroidota bacterium]